jgi:hypothetical protein
VQIDCIESLPVSMNSTSNSSLFEKLFGYSQFFTAANNSDAADDSNKLLKDSKFIGDIKIFANI